MKYFQIKSRLEDQVAIIYPKGHLDAHNVEKFEKELVKLINKKIVKIIINCSDLNYISSAGMGIIMGYLDEIREQFGDIKLCCVSNRVFEIFDLVGFTEIYDFLKDEDTARSRF